MVIITFKDKFILSLFNRSRRWGRLLKNWRVRIGGGLLITILLIIIFSPYIASYSPLEINISNRLQPPSTKNIFGTDSFGRDVFSRVIWGGRISLFVGIMSTLIVGIFGIFIGLIVGYFEKADQVIMRIMDGMMAFPSIFLALVLMAIFGSGIFKVILAISIVFIPRIVRVVRVTVLSIKNLEYIKAARCLGSSNWRIMVKDILPNCINPIVIQLSITFARAILSEAGLSFLGVGVPPPASSWGNIISDGRNLIFIAPWVTFFAGFAILITIFVLNILGDGLRDVLDPKQYF